MIRARTQRMRSWGGFTFIEVLAALLFLGILIPVVVSALTFSSRISVVAERSAIAAQLAENQLNELMLTGSASAASTSGDFGAAWPGYRWELDSADWQADDMTELTMSVFFPVQGSEQQVRLTTLEEGP